MSIPTDAALILAEVVIIVAAGVKLFNHQVNESSYRLARYIIIENVDDEGD